MKWSIKIVEDWDIIWSDPCQKKWLEVLDKSPNGHVFFHPALVKAWVDTYLPLRKLRPIFVVAKQKDVKVLFPLVLWSQNWKNAFRKMIVPMGYSDFDYHDPVFSIEVSEGQIKSFYEQLIAVLQKKFSFDEIAFDGLHQPYLPEQFEQVSEEPCPYIDISRYTDTEGYLNSLSRSFRKNYLRRKQNLDLQAQVSYNICATSTEFREIGYLYSQMMEHHTKRWPNAYKAPGFHKNLLQCGLDAGVLRFYAIANDRELVSTRITFCYKECLYLYMPTINMEYNAYSPGRLSLVYCIEDAYRKGLKKIDQLRGAELYKSEWTSESEMIYNVVYRQSKVTTSVKNVLLVLKKRIAK